MVVPPLPIVSYLTGSIGLLATIHGTISLVLKDIDNTQSFGRQLIDFQLSLLGVSDQLQEWESLWHLDRETPNDLSFLLSHGYWGERMLSVHLHFGHVEAACSVLDKQLKSMYPSDIQKGRRWGDIMQKPASLEESTSVMAEHHQELQSNTSLIEKYWVANFKGDIFKKNLESLSSRMNELENKSLKAFKDCKGINSDGGVDQMRRFIQHKIYLIYMAEKSEGLTKMLFERCVELEAFSADLYIDQFLEENPAGRVKSISKWARSCLPSYRLQITAKATPRTETAVVIMQDRVFDKEKFHYGHENDHGNGLESGLELIQAKQKSVVPIFFNYPERLISEGIAVEMRKLEYKSGSQRGLSSWRNMRDTERTKLSFFFVECIILLMRSRSLSTICTCALQRVRLEKIGIAHTVRLARQTATDTGSPSDQVACSHTSISSETLLQRLGYTLAEIALGKKVGRTHDEGDVAIVEIEQKSWAGHLYADAVEYCLSFETEDTEDLEDFYDAVVKPMHQIYDDLVVKRYYSMPH